jgi:hypothetical protein
MTTPLPIITALARSGALAQAWGLFRAGGYEDRTDDPVALAVKGRLLKDEARRAAGGERVAFLKEAGACYAAADAIAPAPYLLINVATLALLAGDVAKAEDAAHAVLARLDSDTPIAETPYWLGATRAEALLLLGDVAGADQALGAARAADPDGWSDHASTLRQFAAIIAAQGGDATWLQVHRPPKSLHYAGHLGIAAEQSGALRTEIDAVLEDANIGFGYGALAAGVDVIVAEALLARGAELHVTLPTQRDMFLAQSVLPFGGAWVGRFEACLASATTVCEATHVAGDYEPRATALAADIAMGAALLNASRLESGALQLLVIDDGDGPFGGGASTARDGMIWKEAGHDQRIIAAPRSAPVAASSTKQEGHADLALLALLHVRLDGLDQQVSPFWAKMAAQIAAPECPEPEHNIPHGDARLLAFSTPAHAAHFARRLHMLDPPAAFPLTIAAHYGLVHTVEDGLAGPSLLVLGEVAGSALPGSITLSEAFATALALHNIHAEPIREDAGQRLFALLA